MMKSFCAAAVAIAIAMFVSACGQYNQGTTLSVSMTGQPSPIGLTTSSIYSVTPSVFYSGTATSLLMTFNVTEAPTGASVTITPRVQTVGASSAGASPATATMSFDRPGTYVVQVVVQEVGENTNQSSATDQATFVVTGPATD
jgi:hypothetical protein